jgi:hypothetical protein
MYMVRQMPHMHMDARPVVRSVAPKLPHKLRRSCSEAWVHLMSPYFTSIATHHGPRGTRDASTVRPADRRCASSRRWRLERCRGWDLPLIDMYTGTPGCHRVSQNPEEKRAQAPSPRRSRKRCPWSARLHAYPRIGLQEGWCCGYASQPQLQYESNQTANELQAENLPKMRMQ